LHGFSLTGAQFSRLHLSGFEIIAPDLPGHGQSPPAQPDPTATLTTVASTIAQEAPDAPVVGYSQGARLALALAARDLIQPPALILISGTAGIVDTDRRTDRAMRDAELAVTIMDSGMDRFVDWWTSSGLTATANLDDEWRAWDRAVRLENTADGLASALAGYGQGVMSPVWESLERIVCPVLIVTGRNDAKYTTFGVRLASAIGPNAELVTINDAGHNPFNDHPNATGAIISGFLRQHLPSQSSSIGSGEPLDQS
jgi:2-succinyl-6-hydroxy-2,4-cyclohexadiene-1-carboxylate synthase